MNETERYLRQATRGLSGQAKRDAMMELRGAVEDKVWRLTLLGLSGPEATQAALRDLGSPHAVARGLVRVHTLPHAALGAVLAGLACLLGVQALAQVPVVRALPDPEQNHCIYDEDALRHIDSPETVAKLRLQLAQPGGRARLEAKCRSESPVPMNNMLRLSDLIQALTKGGIQVRTLPHLDGFLYLTYPRSSLEQAVDLSAYARELDGDTYVQTWSLINHLRATTGSTLRLTGTVNPVLELGEARLRLGTPTAPVKITELCEAALLELLPEQLSPVPGQRVNITLPLNESTQGRHLKAQVPDGTLLALVSNEASVLQGDNGSVRLRLQQPTAGKLSVPIALGNRPVLVSTPAELAEATRHHQVALLLYHLDPGDLRTLKLTPVPSTQLQFS